MLESSKKMMYEDAALRRLACQFQRELYDKDFGLFNKSGERDKEVLWNFIRSVNFQAALSEEKGGGFEVSEEVFSEIFTKVNTYLLEDEEEIEQEEDIDIEKSINELMDMLRMNHEFSKDRELYLREFVSSNLMYLSSDRFLTDLGLISGSEITSSIELKDYNRFTAGKIATQKKRVSVNRKIMIRDSFFFNKKVVIAILFMIVISILMQFTDENTYPVFVLLSYSLSLFLAVILFLI
ncbi:MAG: hypothetical protein ACPKPY_07970 [Nitrososphaeraceae archaeon]